MDIYLVYCLGGCHHIRVLVGERQLVQRDLQLLRQDGPVQEHPGDTAHTRRHTRLGKHHFVF